MEDHYLSRQERGKLAEGLVSGVYGEPAEELAVEIEGHTNEEYRELVGSASVSVELTEISGYEWKDRLWIPDSISWRPDLIYESKWTIQSKPSELLEPEFWQQRLPPHSLSASVLYPHDRHRREPLVRCRFWVYYPVEVKSGQKPTLTSQQQAALPQVVRDVDYVHPVIATVQMANLPEQFSLTVAMCDDLDWCDGRSRYPADE